MKKKNLIYIISAVIVIAIITIGITYSLWILTREQTGENFVKTSCLNVSMENELNDISLKNTFPLLDEEGLDQKPYTFKIKNNCEDYANYEIDLEMLSETSLDSEYVKISLNEKGDKGVPTNLSEYKKYSNLKISGTKEGRTLKTSRLKPKEEKEYELRIWIDEDVTTEDNIMNKIYKSKVIVESKNTDKPYTESILNGTDPVLDGDLIPITINEENGKVTRADETKKWYSYAEQKWANAVILKDGKSDPGPDEPIEENDIESYFVWIPRYRYEIFDEANYNSLTTKSNKAKIINVEFENKDEPVKMGSSIGQMLTHPAFTSFNTNGIWVGKFQTGYDGAATTKNAEVNPVDEEDAILATEKVIIKPNVYSWRNIQVAKAYTIGRHYEATLNSHLMKNTEWGAVAYLQQSEYGSHQSIRINNNSDYLTGYAAKNEPTTGFTGTNELCSEHPDACNEYGGSEQGVDGEYNTNYFNKVSVIASTTNNYTGVYDMSGGAWEYMMAGIDDNSTGDGKTGKLTSGRNDLYNSGFNGKFACPECDVNKGNNKDIKELINGIDLPTDERYFDKYEYSSMDTTFNRGMLGDATKEMGPFQSLYGRYIGSWYGDEGWFPYTQYSWFRRGGCYYLGTGSGIFDFDASSGCITDYYSFRLVLAF